MIPAIARLAASAVAGKMAAGSDNDNHPAPQSSRNVSDLTKNLGYAGHALQKSASNSNDRAQNAVGYGQGPIRIASNDNNVQAAQISILSRMSGLLEGIKNALHTQIENDEDNASKQREQFLENQNQSVSPQNGLGSVGPQEAKMGLLGALIGGTGAAAFFAIPKIAEEIRGVKENIAKQVDELRDIGSNIGNWVSSWFTGDRSKAPDPSRPKPQGEPGVLSDRWIEQNLNKVLGTNVDIDGDKSNGIAGPSGEVVRGKGKATVKLSQQDIMDLKKTVQTEWVRSAGKDQMKGIVDTILNRTASGKWGDSVRSVVDAKSQFTAINGREAWKKGINSVRDYKDSFVRSDVSKAVDEYLAARAKGMASAIGDNLNYANPHFSDRKNLRWINALDGPVLGKGNAIHRHGTTPENQKYRPGTVSVVLPNGQSQPVPQPQSQPVPTPGPTPESSTQPAPPPTGWDATMFGANLTTRQGWARSQESREASAPALKQWVVKPVPKSLPQAPANQTAAPSQAVTAHITNVVGGGNGQQPMATPDSTLNLPSPSADMGTLSYSIYFHTHK